MDVKKMVVRKLFNAYECEDCGETRNPAFNVRLPNGICCLCKPCLVKLYLEIRNSLETEMETEMEIEMEIERCAIESFLDAAQRLNTGIKNAIKKHRQAEKEDS